MKVRSGFVSNSSSSSFIVAYKGTITDAQTQIKKALTLPKSHPLSRIGELVTEQVLSEIKDNGTIYDDINTYLKDHLGYDEEDLKDPVDENDLSSADERVIKYLNQGLKVIAGQFYDDNGELDLTGAAFDYESDDFAIFSEDGY
jgi:hypothetical protein